MNNPKIPFILKLAMAMPDQNAADQIVKECIGEIAGKILGIANEYDFLDLPFVAASMQIASRSLSALLDDSGRALSDEITNSTACIAIDLNEIRKQIEEDGKASE